VAETTVSIATLGVEDPELCTFPRRPVAAPGDDGLRSLTHDVPSEADPRLPLELEAKAGRFGDCGRQPRSQPGRLERDEEGLGTPGQAGEATQPVGDLRVGRAGRGAWRKVEDEDVDRPTGQEHPGDRQPFVQGLGGEHDEPVEPNPPCRRLDGVERPRKVEPGDDRPVGLGFGNEPECDGRRTGARRSLEGNARAARQPARSDDRIERREAGPDDPLDASSRLARGRRSELGWVVGRLGRKRRRGQRSDHPRSCGAPSRLERRQSGRDVRGEVGHRTVRLEHVL
jgi:hypothetical protein